jgi:hypothetical protein
LLRLLQPNEQAVVRIWEAEARLNEDQLVAAIMSSSSEPDKLMAKADKL